VQDRVVVLERGCPLGEGAEVLVAAVPKPISSPDQRTILEKLQKYAGAVTDLPPDMARNHDHYLHGGPKK